MKCASLLRETMWSMVQETHGTVDFGYAAYTADDRSRFADAYASFQQDEGPRRRGAWRGPQILRYDRGG
jgi:hypothetical protein